jgi:hypothetical protein
VDVEGLQSCRVEAPIASDVYRAPARRDEDQSGLHHVERHAGEAFTIAWTLEVPLKQWQPL